MAQAAAKTCEICVSAHGSWYCLDCEQCFCENCKLLHARQRISANHEFKETSDFIPEVISKCTDHNEAFTFVCLACDVTVCKYCVTEKHNGHKLSQLKDTILQLKTKIEQEIVKKLNKTSSNVSKMEQGIAVFNCQVKTVIRTITDEGNKIKYMVDQCTAKMIASIQEKARNESKQISALLDDHKTAFGIANALDSRKRSIGNQNRHNESLIKMLKSLNKDVDELEVCPLPEFPSATVTPKIVKENDICQLLGRCDLFKTKVGRDKESKFQSTPSMYSPPSMNLFKTKVGRDKESKFQSTPSMYSPPSMNSNSSMYPTFPLPRNLCFSYTCLKCGRQQIQDTIGYPYVKDTLYCCQWPMERNN